MNCVKCGHESPEGTSFCPACGTRLVAREWTISGLVVGLIALSLLVLGAGGTWLVLGRHKTPPPIPAPTVQVLPGAVKPSPQIAADATQPTDPFKDFAPAKISSSAKPAVRTTLPHASVKAQPVVPRTDERLAHAVTYPLGPLQNQIAARTQLTKHFTIPENLADTHFQTNVVRLNGSKRLHVWVVGDNRQIFFDSGVCVESHIDLKLKEGNYLLIVANQAILMPITVDIRGSISGRIP